MTKRTDDKREKLLNAAEKLFSERSYANTQIAEIAKTAGVGIGTFYKHFPNKDALLAELLSTLFADVRRQIGEIRSGAEKWSPMEKLVSFRRVYEVVFRVMLGRPQISLTFLRSGYGASPEVSEIVWDGLRRIVQDLTADFIRAEKDGLVVVPDKDALGHAIVGMALQLAHKCIVDKRPSLQEAVDLCTRVTVGTLFAFMTEETREKLNPLYNLVLSPASS
jgi:AcrR family transcriptional regulator